MREVEIASVPVVVAAKPIPVGARLTAEDLKVAAWPARTPVPGAFADTKQLVDRGTIAIVAENEPVTAFKVAGPESGSGLPPVIPEGMRAMSISVNDVVGVAGFVLPGTRVDVLLSVDNPGAATVQNRWRVCREQRPHSDVGHAWTGRKARTASRSA